MDRLVRCMIDYGFLTLGFDVIAASTDAANAASVRVLEKLGMSLRRRESVAGLDTVFYELPRPEALERPRKALTARAAAHYPPRARQGGSAYMVQPGQVRPVGFAATERTDAWWVAPLVQGLGLATLICYANWAAYQGKDYLVGNYLSPLYSPLIDVEGLPFSPAFLILLPPVLFRATCYYYRKAYYRSYFFDPPACAVGELGGKQGYRGETAFPFVLQNLHRYLFYATLFYLPFLWLDAFHAMNFDGKFGIGVGTLVIAANALALTLYSFSCHSARHLVGGNLDCFSCTAVNRTRHAAWKRASFLNARHMLFAWTSFLTVCGADLYVRLVARGAITDLRLL